MKSILAKQGPQSSPWLPILVRREMQTGGRRRSATWPSRERTGLAQAECTARNGSASALSSTPLMSAMIEPGVPPLEERKRFTP